MKKGSLKLAIICLTVLLIIGCSSSSPKKSPYVVNALKPESNETKVNMSRLESLKQTARTLAAQASLASRSIKINMMLEKQKRQLDQIFNFNYLMLNNNVLPPILVEGRNALNLDDNYTIRVSEHDYKIEQAPRFVTAPPNWRHYIWMAYSEPEQPHKVLLPKNAMERQIWNEYIRLGWAEGSAQADEIFSANLARLKRDYQGMILYRKLLAQNMVTPPYVSQADLGITGDSNTLHINDRVLRITAISQLKQNSKEWRPAMATKESPNKKTSLINTPPKGKLSY